MYITNPLSLNRTSVTVNHFDIDALCAVFAAMHAGRMSPVQRSMLRDVARIGDFRELRAPLSPSEADALRVCCWINSEERRLYRRPFERKRKPQDVQEDSARNEHDKWSYFLGSKVGLLDLVDFALNTNQIIIR